MADARFSESFWTDPKIKTLEPDIKLMFAYLFTNPHRNYCGVYYLPKHLISIETGISVARIDRGMDTCIDRNLISYDPLFETIFVHSMLTRQTGGQSKLSDQQLKGIANHLQTLHNCPLIKDFLDKYSHLEIPFSYTPTDTPMDTQSQSKSQSKSKYIDIPPKSLKPKKPSPTFLPENFTISDRVRTWAKDKGFNHLGEQLEWFTDWARAHGKQYADWDAAFMNCIRGNWGKIDLGKPEIATKKREGCKECGRWKDKCICHDPEKLREWKEYQAKHGGRI